MVGRRRVSELGKENTTDESPPSFPVGSESSDNDRSKVKYGRGEKPEEQEREDVLWKAVEGATHSLLESNHSYFRFFS